jgi:hypothetical protein
MKPGEFVYGWICFDETFKVDVVPFLDVIGIERGPHPERQHGSVCGTKDKNRFRPLLRL